MSTSKDARYSRLFHLRRLSLSEKVISKSIWLSAFIAVGLINADGYPAGSAPVAWMTILINVAFPFTPAWKRLVIERPRRLLKTDRRLQISIYCLLYLILLVFILRKSAYWLNTGFNLY